VVTHDGQVAAHTERILFLSDGKISKEKEGLHLTKKNICPYCKAKLQSADERCPKCGKIVRQKRKHTFEPQEE
jgi:tRNA(Ile2) C34 agmatinyltransferase TiaS